MNWAIAFFTAVTLITSLSHAAAPKTRLVCATYHLTTSYSLLETPTNFELQVTHHNGTDLLPIHDAIITLNDLSFLEQKGRLLAKMGANYKIDFEKSECQAKKDEWICSVRKPMKVGDLEIQGLTLKVSPRQLITRLISYKSYQADLSIVKDGEGHNSPMSYALNECTFYE